MAFKINSFLLMTLSIVVIASIFCHVSAANDGRKLLDSSDLVSNTPALSQLFGDWQPIKDAKDPKVVKVGEFAVDAYNRISNSFPLTFESVLGGQFQVVNGITYKLVISARQNVTTTNYLAVVNEHSGDNVKTLISFEKFA
ncbi:cysteine proteinase inhibitor 6-like [Nicotiana tabacum]|uniref:Cystatain n=1 Tax=Nicotiana tabacum TaxID=4097 RepID=T2BRR7_TOBAC|nr:cysteine proteinase inhibitor 5-like [Nicotiana tomentosiformis]AGV15819.1 cystatain [Nicotiana tabacum]